MRRVGLSSPFSIKAPKGFDGSAFSEQVVILPSMRTRLALFCFAAAAAMAAPNFSGEWKLDLSRSQFGPVPAPLAATRKVTEQGVTLSWSSYQKSAQREATTELKYTT